MAEVGKFAIELLIHSAETIEKRIAGICRFIIHKHPHIAVIIKDIYATGVYGNDLSDKIMTDTVIRIDTNSLNKLFTEDGQIIELDMILQTGNIFSNFLIVDGTDVNILSNQSELLQNDIVGEFRYLDLKLFGSLEF